MLEFAFLTRELRALCEQDKDALASLGPAAAGALRRRLADLSAASHVFELPAGNVRLDPSFPGGDACVVDLSDGWVLRFRAGHAEPPRQQDGTVDWRAVSRIQIMKVFRP